MARLALISDIHANLEALQSVLADVEHLGADRIICLGDVVGYGPDPAACVEIVYDLCEVTIVGNHDEAAIQSDAPGGFNPAALASILFTRESLTRIHKNTIRAWEQRRLVEGVALTHGSFGRERYAYLTSTAAIAESIGGMGARIGAIGHTHVPAFYACAPQVRTRRDVQEIDLIPGAPTPLDTGLRHILNPGSVGQPRDRNPDASWALLDTATHTFELRRVPYDVETVEAKIRSAGLPNFLGERLHLGA